MNVTIRTHRKGLVRDEAAELKGRFASLEKPEENGLKRNK